MPIGRNDLRNPQRSCATLCSETTESDLIAGLEGSLCPACSHQVIGAGELALPLLDFALIVLCFKENHYVRIDELEVHDRAPDRHGFRCLVRGVSMMCEQRQRDHHSNDRYATQTVRPHMFLRYEYPSSAPRALTPP